MVDGDLPDFNLALRKEEFVGGGEPKCKFSKNSQSCDQKIQQNQGENNRLDLLLEVAAQQSAFVLLDLLADLAANISSLVGSGKLELLPLAEGVLNAFEEKRINASLQCQTGDFYIRNIETTSKSYVRYADAVTILLGFFEVEFSYNLEICVFWPTDFVDDEP